MLQAFVLKWKGLYVKEGYHIKHASANTWTSIHCMMNLWMGYIRVELMIQLKTKMKIDAFYPQDCNRKSVNQKPKDSDFRRGNKVNIFSFFS